jgi:hypothetical protein
MLAVPFAAVGGVPGAPPRLRTVAPQTSPQPTMGLSAISGNAVATPTRSRMDAAPLRGKAGRGRRETSAQRSSRLIRVSCSWQMSWRR